jgi:hypothetical protein
LAGCLGVLAIQHAQAQSSADHPKTAAALVHAKVVGEDAFVPFGDALQIFVRNRQPDGVAHFGSDRIAILTSAPPACGKFAVKTARQRISALGTRWRHVASVQINNATLKPPKSIATLATLGGPDASGANRLPTQGMTDKIMLCAESYWGGLL